jgi:hypothetical protein
MGKTIHLDSGDIHIKRPGALRAKAGVKGDEKIPLSTLHRLANSSNPRTRKQANLAITMRGWHHGGKS